MLFCGSSDSPEVFYLKSCENNAFCYFTGYSDFCLDRFVDHKKAGMEKIVRNLVAVSKAKMKEIYCGGVSFRISHPPKRE